MSMGRLVSVVVQSARAQMLSVKPTRRSKLGVLKSTPVGSVLMKPSLGTELYGHTRLFGRHVLSRGDAPGAADTTSEYAPVRSTTLPVMGMYIIRRVRDHTLLLRPLRMSSIDSRR